MRERERDCVSVCLCVCVCLCGCFHVDSLYPFCDSQDGHNLEFYIEGGRSRTGKVGQPKLGMLGVALEGHFEGRVSDLIVVPISIQYDRVVEGSSYSRQLLGMPKQKESLRSVLASRHYLRFNFGNIVIKFGDPVLASSFVASQTGAKAVDARKGDLRGVVSALAHNLVWRINRNTVIPPASLVCTVLLTHNNR